MKFYNLFLCILFLLFSFSLSAQKQGIFKRLYNVSFPEKVWAFTHPFVAIKAWKITKEVRRITEKDSTLDMDSDGGQVDAFRHIFWMASLSQKISSRKIRKLGIAHEKGNYLDFKKGKHEEKDLPDSVSSEMDLRNNEIGIILGCENKKISQDKMILKVKSIILDGKAWVIYKNSEHKFLDSLGNIIEKKWYEKKWNNPKYLIRSDKSRSL